MADAIEDCGVFSLVTSRRYTELNICTSFPRMILTSAPHLDLMMMNLTLTSFVRSPSDIWGRQLILVLHTYVGDDEQEGW